MELKDVKTSKELEQYWTERGQLVKETINVDVDLADEEDCFERRFFDKKTIVYVTDEVSGGYVTYLEEMGNCAAQGETKEEALKDLYKIVKDVLGFEPEYPKWLDVILTYKQLQGTEDLAHIINTLQNKYSIKENDIIF